jgi:hypothetical protein
MPIDLNKLPHTHTEFLPDLNQQPVPQVQEEEDHLQVHLKNQHMGKMRKVKFMSKHISNKVSPYLNLMEILHMIKKKSIISRKVSPNISCKMDSLVCMA